MTKLLGYLLIAAPFALIFYGTVREHGLVLALMVWSASLVMAGVTILGVRLVTK